jgi:hypothetical protein
MRYPLSNGGAMEVVPVDSNGEIIYVELRIGDSQGRYYSYGFIRPKQLLFFFEELESLWILWNNQTQEKKVSRRIEY